MNLVNLVCLRLMITQMRNTSTIQFRGKLGNYFISPVFFQIPIFYLHFVYLRPRLPLQETYKITHLIIAYFLRDLYDSDSGNAGVYFIYISVANRTLMEMKRFGFSRVIAHDVPLYKLPVIEGSSWILFTSMVCHFH